MTCGKCGGVMVGDGYTTHTHCEYAENYEDKEPDAEATLCENKVKINAGIKSGDELARRLMSGEVFWTKNHNKIWYDKEYNNPFRFDSTPINTSWGKLSTFKKEVLISELTLEEKLELRITCYAFVDRRQSRLEGTVEELLHRGICIRELVNVSPKGYEDQEIVYWEYAREVDVRFVKQDTK